MLSCKIASSSGGCLFRQNMTSDVKAVWSQWLLREQGCLTGGWRHRYSSTWLRGRLSGWGFPNKVLRSFPCAETRVAVHMKCPLLLSDFNHDCNRSTKFIKTPWYQISLQSAQRFNPPNNCTPQFPPTWVAIVIHKFYSWSKTYLPAVPGMPPGNYTVQRPCHTDQCRAHTFRLLINLSYDKWAWKL
jgi:hypothetical protein